MTTPQFQLDAYHASLLDLEMPFGKHRGMTLREIGESDPAYLDWLSGLDDLRPNLRTAITYACTHFRHAIDDALDD